jgi:hypothetical protein
MPTAPTSSHESPDLEPVYRAPPRERAGCSDEEVATHDRHRGPETIAPVTVRRGQTLDRLPFVSGGLEHVDDPLLRGSGLTEGGEIPQSSGRPDRHQVAGETNAASSSGHDTPGHESVPAGIVA